LVQANEQLASQLGRSLIHRRDGSTGLNGAWSEIVPKVRSSHPSCHQTSQAHSSPDPMSPSPPQGHIIEEEAEISRSYERMYETLPTESSKIRDTIYMYDPNVGYAGVPPTWVTGPSGM
jgi:hypothetical protein